MAMESPMNIPQRAPRTRSGTEEAMVVTLLDLGSGSGGGLIVPELQQESESGTPVRRRTAIKRSPASTSKCCIEHHLLPFCLELQPLLLSKIELLFCFLAVELA